MQSTNHGTAPGAFGGSRMAGATSELRVQPISEATPGIIRAGGLSHLVIG